MDNSIFGTMIAGKLLIMFAVLWGNLSLSAANTDAPLYLAALGVVLCYLAIFLWLGVRLIGRWVR